MTQRDPLATATLAAIRALWDEDNPSLGTDAVYEYLEFAGQITPPQSLVPTLERLARVGNFRLAGGFMDATGAELHGARTIQDVAPQLIEEHG